MNLVIKEHCTGWFVVDIFAKVPYGLLVSSKTAATQVKQAVLMLDD